MIQSTLNRTVPAHVAVIMDGNGRWATRRGRPRSEGHVAGARATRRIITAAARAGVRTLTLYAFSSDNWNRPEAEVRALMQLFAHYLDAEAGRCVAEGIRLTVIGRRDRLSASLLDAIEDAERRTAAGQTMRVRLAIDYSARAAILAAARPAELAVSGAFSSDAFAAAIARAIHDPEPAGDVDLLVRSGGELRLSDFLLWECAYAELWFSQVLWPDFGARHLREALGAFARRQRRFGGLAPAGSPDERVSDPGDAVAARRCA